MQISLMDVDWNNVTAWPKNLQYGAYGICFLVVVVVGYLWDSRVLMESIQHSENTEKILKNTLVEKQYKTANLAAYQEQLKDMRARFGLLLKQLPEQTEVPGLVDDISRQGILNGLVFQSIRLLPEQQMDFYTELPIQISVKGTYHQLALFVSAMASLPRIVTVHDFTIQLDKDRLAQQGLVMDLRAATYRFSERASEAGHAKH
jgi:type IV pilus assembly protein PilO